MSDLLERTLNALKAALATQPRAGALRLQVAELLAELDRVSEAVEQARAALADLPEGPDRERAEGLIARFAPDAAPANVTAMPGLKLRGDGRAVLAPPPEPEPGRVDFSDVGGLDEVKETVRLKIVLPFQRPDVFRAYGKQAGGGVLLYGPPGCGKTMLARAVAGELGARFVSVAIHDVLSMWLGQSEQQLRALFEDARQRAPAVLFFDEVEAIGADRQRMQGAGRSLVNQLLSELDGVDVVNGKLLVVAATNAPWHVDPALLRPGRFDRVVFVPPPDAPARAEILRLHLRDRLTAPDLQLQAIVDATDGWSGADLAGLVERSVEAPLREALRGGAMRPLQHEDLRRALQESRPTTEPWFETATRYVTFANSSGLYDDLSAWLSKRKPPKRRSWLPWGS